MKHPQSPSSDPQRRSYRLRTLQPIYTHFDYESAKVAGPGYVALLRPGEGESEVAAELLVERYSYELVILNDQEIRPIVDKKTDHIWGVVLGSYLLPEQLRSASEDIEQAGEKIAAQSQPYKSNKRGTTFSAHQFGYLLGNGRKQPLPFNNTCRDREALEVLLQNPMFEEVSRVTSNLFKKYNPCVHAEYKMTTEDLEDEHPSIVRPFKNTVLPAATFNFGPQTIANHDYDKTNLSYGWCGITAFGEFDPDLGGYLVLHKLKLVIWFPPGSTTLIPSAIVKHSNTPLTQETRYSLIQYGSGHLF